MVDTYKPEEIKSNVVKTENNTRYVEVELPRVPGRSNVEYIAKTIKTVLNDG